MIKPFVDAMSVSPEGGHALFDNTVAEAVSLPQPSAATDSSSKHTALDTSLKVPQSVTYTDNTVSPSYFLTLLS